MEAIDQAYRCAHAAARVENPYGSASPGCRRLRAVEDSVLTTAGLQALIDALGRRGYRVIGPTVRGETIVYEEISSVEDLPRGWTDSQDAGRYRLARCGDDALFGFAVGAHSWKRFLHPPLLELSRAEGTGDALHIAPTEERIEPLAFIGVRACELHAIGIQDRVFLGGAHVDPHYRARREGCFLVAVNCGTAGGTCFCVSMQCGPRASRGYDLALTEIRSGTEHLFYLEAGSALGGTIAGPLPRRAATEQERLAAEAVTEHTAASMGRQMRADDVRELLLRNLEHPRWENVAERCLSCGNCTMVCPTCFCTAVEETSDLVSGASTRTQRWDSCFTLEFSHVHGGSVRSSARSRYRQWLMHKLATWHDQFGTSGCVGCGRCITWCPAAIDLTEEVSAIRKSESG